MNNDIVQYLVDEAVEEIKLGRDLLAEGLLDAANEIMRLREQLRALEAERDQWIRQAIGHG